MNPAELRAQGWPCPTADEMRAIERDAITRFGLAAEFLMETAGRAVAEAVVAAFPERRRPLVVCGSGNNGGDGFVVARVLREWDPACAPRVVLLGDRARLGAEARANLDRLRQAGIEPTVQPDEKRLRALAQDCDLLIDALFGVGLSRPVEGELADALRALRDCGLPVVALDVPSGCASDNGKPLGVELPADLIVTLGLPKLGLALRPLAARILVADIGLPLESLERVGVRQHALTRSAAAALLPERGPEAHKGSFGHVLVVGGSEGKTGAVALAAVGALRAGAGLVTAAVPRSLHPTLAQKLTEAMTLPLADTGRGTLAATSAEQILREAALRDVVALGPGLGRDPESAHAVVELLSRLGQPAVVDADALNVFEAGPEALRGPGPRVLTPHPGEAARLLARSTADVQGDRVGAARELAALTRAVVVLKGARTVIAEPGGELFINLTGGPGLASGGTGDVLAGVIAGLLGQGLPAPQAARLGVYLHGAAGDLGPPVGGLAGEVAQRIPQVWEALLAERESGVERLDAAGRLRRFC